MSEAIGELARLGLRTASDVWRLAPDRYVPLTDYIAHLTDLPESEDDIVRPHAVINGYINQPATYDSIQQQTRLAVRIQDGSLVHIACSAHPDDLPGSWRRRATSAAIQGALLVTPSGDCEMVDPIPIDPSRIGHVAGVYRGIQSHLTADSVRERVMALTVDDQYLQEAFEALASQLPGYSLDDVMDRWGNHYGYKGMTAASLSNALRALHYPKSCRQGELAKQLFRDLAALSQLLLPESDLGMSEDHQAEVERCGGQSISASQEKCLVFGCPPSEASANVANAILANLSAPASQLEKSFLPEQHSSQDAPCP